MLPTLSRLLLSLVAIVTFCDTVSILGWRQIIGIPHGEATLLKRAFGYQDPLIPKAGNIDTRSGQLDGGDDVKGRLAAANAGYLYPGLGDGGSAAERIDFADDLGLDNLGRASGPIYVKPKFQRMEELADEYGMKHGPQKIVGGNQELAEFGLWQPPANSELEAEYSGDYDWMNGVANEGRPKFADFKPNGDRQWYDDQSETRESRDMEDDGFWIYELQEKENDKFVPNALNELLWLNKHNRALQPLPVQQSQEDTGDDHGGKP